MALALTTIASSIAALSVSGLTIRDIDDIPPAGGVRSGPELIALPNYVTNFTVEFDSFGSGATAKMTVTYELNYRLLYAPAGSAQALSLFGDMVAMVGLIWDAVLAVVTISGAIDIMPAGIINMGLVNDPAEGSFYGCDLAFQVKEFVN